MVLRHLALEPLRAMILENLSVPVNGIARDAAYSGGPEEARKLRYIYLALENKGMLRFSYKKGKPWLLNHLNST